MRDLADEPAVAIRRNFVSFERKFRIQQRELVHEMTRVVVHEGDRVISSVLAGPHERIIDPDIYEIWKDMRWRGIVKARHLALAIHDYYSQKLDDQKRAEAQKTPAPQRAIDHDDLWALECLDLMRLQQITEAFDSDASGFVTVQEVNTFTTSRPKGWSLLHWLAYWAVGWQVAMTTYRRKIRALLARMRATAFRAAIRGRDHAVQQYLDEVVPLVDSMTQPFREDTERLFLAARFEGYIAREEVRLREGLETARYELDALDTLALVNGPMRLERNLFVILYLVLRRHCDIMKVGRRVILHPDELADAAGVVRLVKDAFDYRVADLAGLFTQRRLMVSLELSDYASGMMAQPYGGININYGADEDDLVGVAMDNIQSGRTGDPEDDCSETVLKYPPHFEEFYPENEDGVESKGAEVVEDLQTLVGHWAGVQITEESDRTLHRKTFSFDFHPAPGDPKKVIAVPLLSAPWVCTRATVTGTFTGVDEEGRSTYALVETFNTSALPGGHTKMTLGVDGTLRGERDNFHVGLDTLSNVRPQVVMKKGVPPDIMHFYPQLPELHANKPAALWRFAIAATLHDVRRRRFSWSFLEERRDRKRRLASLLRADAHFIAESDGDGLHSNDRAELVRLANKTTPADWHFFAWASVEPSRFTWVLPWCAECRRVLKTVRPCLRCSCTELWIRRPGRVGAQSPGVALCNRAKCLKRHVEYGDHSVIKTRTEGWKLDAFFKERGLDPEKLARTGRRAVRAVTAEPASRKNVRRSRRSSASFGSALHSLYMSSETSEDEDARSRGPERDGLSSDNSAGSDDEWARARSSKQSLPDEGAAVPLSLPIGIPGVGDDPDSTLPPQPKCTGCSEEVKFPCWLCIECSEPTYICYKCDGRDKGASCYGAHIPEHVLLMLRAPDVSGPPSTSRIRRLRSRSPPLRAPRSLRLPAPPVAVLAGPPPAGFNDWPQPLGRMVREESEDSQGTVSEGRLGRVEERMDGFESRMEGVESRLTRIDGMLTAMMGLLQGHKP
ncbi:hypothetical protein C2E23DRAFT_773550 [Lenzites betulinus]|nr:hypothetical protein C2E23DRAFT_773550 [Lenzites betulinus]